MATTAVAWSMRAPSKTGSKEYRLLVFDQYCLVGWGSTTGTMQYRMHVLTNAGSARNYALAQTSVKESKGYAMHHMPMASPIPADQWAVELHRYRETRGASTYLDQTFRMILLEGTALDG